MVWFILVRLLALLVAVLALASPGRSGELAVTAEPANLYVSIPDVCFMTALLIDAPTPDAVIALMRDLQKGGPMRLSIVNSTGRPLIAKDGTPCETLLLDVRIKGERVFSVAAEHIEDGRPWYRKLWPW